VRRALAAGVAALGLDRPEDLIQGLVGYLGLLQRWNRVYNLTAVRDPGEMVALHILDSLSILPWVHGPRLADVGTGPGLPGIPLALARPDLRVALVDSNLKKTRFCTEAVRVLGLAGRVEVVRARVEAWHPPQPFDTVVSRAFARLADFVAASAHLLAPGGRLLAMKGRDPGPELAALGPDWTARVEPLTVPGLDARRHLVIIARSGDAAVPPSPS